MKRAQTTGPKMVIFTPLLGQIGGLLGQWPTSYNVKKMPCLHRKAYIFFHYRKYQTHVMLGLCSNQLTTNITVKKQRHKRLKYHFSHGLKHHNLSSVSPSPNYQAIKYGAETQNRLDSPDQAVDSL